MGQWRARAVVTRVLSTARILDQFLAGLALCRILDQGAYIGPQPAVFSELFPTATRYSGASLSLTLGTILGGALPAIARPRSSSAPGDSALITIYITNVAHLVAVDAGSQ